MIIPPDTNRAGVRPSDDTGRDKLRHLDLFSGIGGFSLGLERTGGFVTVAFCEIEEFCRRVLAKNWPGVPIYEDVRILTPERLAADGIAVDVITAGFPCQDLSEAKQGAAGLDGEPAIWPSVSWAQCDPWPAEPDFPRVAHGIPEQPLFRHALGNAVVPQIPEILGRAILAARSAA